MARKTARRGRGESSIYQRADGRWTAVVSNGFDAEGRRRRTFAYGRTKAEVQAKLDTLKDQTPGQRGDPRTVGELLDRWLEEIKANTAPKTYRWYCGAVEFDIRPALGKRKLADLTALDIQAFYKRVRARGAGGATQVRVHATLRPALKAACRWGILSKNPMAGVAAPKWKRPPIRPLSGSDLPTFLDAIRGDRYEALYLLAIFTGMRAAEIFGLRWADVDLKDGIVRVVRQLTDENGPVESIERNKTAGSRRPIRVPARALAALREQRKRSTTLEVFASPNGELIHASNFLRRELYPMLERAGLPRTSFRKLRHTFATIMLSANVHPKVVQEMLGHKKITTTLDVYSHYLPTMQDEAVSAIDALFPAERGSGLSVSSRSAGALGAREPRRKP